MINETATPNELVGLVTIRVNCRQPAEIIAHARRYIGEFGLTDEDGKPLVVADDDYQTALLYLFDYPDDVHVGTVTSAEIIQPPTG